ncbi:hypothetical protein EDB87DRAFT_628167 [Lactarius vividus]|nr:hypothetical protein EDB87DRAFT_628167 [Lactarius vividus]
MELSIASTTTAGRTEAINKHLLSVSIFQYLLSYVSNVYNRPDSTTIYTRLLFQTTRSRPLASPTRITAPPCGYILRAPFYVRFTSMSLVRYLISDHFMSLDSATGSACTDSRNPEAIFHIPQDPRSSAWCMIYDTQSADFKGNRGINLERLSDLSPPGDNLFLCQDALHLVHIQYPFRSGRLFGCQLRRACYVVHPAFGSVTIPTCPRFGS